MALAGHDVEWLFGEIAHAARRGKPLAEAVAELARAEEGTRRGRAAQRLAQRLTEGQSLSAAVAAEERNYPPGSAAAIEAGEKSGRLPEALTAMAEGVGIEGMMRHSVSTTLLYPLLIAVGCSVIMVYLKVSLLPHFYHMFDELNVELPYITQALPNVVLIVAVVAVFIPAGVLFLVFIVTLPWFLGRSIVDFVRTTSPLLSRPIRHMLLSRWCATAGPLFAAGVPEAKVVRIAGESTGNIAVQRACERMSAYLNAGASLPDSMVREPFFPPVLVWMVDASLRRGNHRDIWPLVQGIYRDHARAETAVMAVALGLCFVCATILLVAFSAMALLAPFAKLLNCLCG